jgi:hypothetical protein
MTGISNEQCQHPEFKVQKANCAIHNQGQIVLKLINLRRALIRGLWGCKTGRWPRLGLKGARSSRLSDQKLCY